MLPAIQQKVGVGGMGQQQQKPAPFDEVAHANTGAPATPPPAFCFTMLYRCTTTVKTVKTTAKYCSRFCYDECNGKSNRNNSCDDDNLK